MRYIGNKENVVDRIFGIMQECGLKGIRFFDFFTGTTNVARFFKKKGFEIGSCDLLYLSYCLQKAYIENNEEPQFQNLLQEIPNISTRLFLNTPLEHVVEYLNSIEPQYGFIYNNYTPDGTSELKQPRMYFSSENGAKIDAIRLQIEEWYKENRINEKEYYILLACLIETVPYYANISGVYAAFQKKWDPRALKPFKLRTIEIIKNKRSNIVYNENSLSICDKIDTDILYLDPPYNERQYAPNYHVLETIAKYDNPQIKGVTGMRDYSGQKSSFCSASTALRDLSYVADSCKYKYLVLSYNSEGIMPQEEIISTLSKYGKVILKQFEYARYKSNNKGLSKTKKTVLEQLYILEYGK